MAFFAAYGANLAAIAGVVGAYAFFLGYVDETVTWFAANRQLMVAVLLVHLSLFALYWRLNAEARELRRRGGKKDGEDD